MPRLHMVLVNRCWIRCSIALIIEKELVHRRQTKASHSETTTDALRNSDHNQPDRNQHSPHRARRHPTPSTRNRTTAQPKPNQPTNPHPPQLPLSTIDNHAPNTHIPRRPQHKHRNPPPPEQLSTLNTTPVHPLHNRYNCKRSSINQRRRRTMGILTRRRWIVLVRDNQGIPSQVPWIHAEQKRARSEQSEGAEERTVGMEGG